MVVNKVPKLIHQLWIGDKPKPSKCLESIKDSNPDYEYMFWDEESLNNLSLPKRYRQKIDFMEELNGKCDMYRWIILEKYGGVFIDADIVAIESLDDFLLNKSFFCWEQEQMRPNLCATTVMGFTPKHPIPQMAINWILDNRITSPAWISVGPQLLSNIYHSLNEDIKKTISVFPSYYFLPDHLTGFKYKGHGKVYTTHLWGSTHRSYRELNTQIPEHHTKPSTWIDVNIDDGTSENKIKEIVNSVKHMPGHFGVNINCNSDIRKYIKSTRFVNFFDLELVLQDLGEIQHKDLTIEEKIKPYFKEMLDVCGGKWINGWGSYLFEGQKYEYADNMKLKQELLFDKCRNKKNILEIGVYMGHSLLLMLLANPSCHITAVDIDDTLSKPVIDYLNEHFNNRVTFIKSDSLEYLKNCNDKFDFFHIDGNHNDNFVKQEIEYIMDRDLSSEDNIEIIFDDEDQMRPTQQYLQNNYNVIEQITPESSWANTYFNIKLRETLTELMNKYGSDKGQGRHNYTLQYESLFDNIRSDVKSFCEVGLGTTNPNIKSNMGWNGKPLASIYGWRDYFQNATIYGGDVDPDILKQGDRFSTFEVDMTNPDSVREFWNNIPERVDIMLDDGLHEFDANVCLFENSIDMWNSMYIIEDVGNIYFEEWDKKIEEWKIKYPDFKYQKVYQNIPTNNYDNNLIVITNRLV